MSPFYISFEEKSKKVKKHTKTFKNCDNMGYATTSCGKLIDLKSRLGSTQPRRLHTMRAENKE